MSRVPDAGTEYVTWSSCSVGDTARKCFWEWLKDRVTDQTWCPASFLLMINPLLCSPPRPASAVYATLHFLVSVFFFFPPTVWRDKGGGIPPRRTYLFTPGKRNLTKILRKHIWSRLGSEFLSCSSRSRFLRLVRLYGLFVYVHVSGLVFKGEGEGQGRQGQAAEWTSV